MDDKHTPEPPGVSQGLMEMSLELAFEDPVMALRLADLAMRASLYLREAVDPHAAQEAFHRNRWRRGERVARAAG